MSKLISYPVTPFTENGQVDEKAFEALLEHLMLHGADAICVLGSVAEVAYLSSDETKRIISIALNYVRGRCPVYVGITAKNTISAIELASYAKDCGADGLMLSPFSYFPLSENEIYSYVRAIADATAIPIIFYNNPLSSRVTLSPSFLISMANRIAEIIAIKDSSGDISQIKALMTLKKVQQIEIFNGSNKIAVDSLKMGVDGWCTVTPCFLDSVPKSLMLSESRSQQRLSVQQKDKLNHLLVFICEHGLVASSKAAMMLVQRSVGLPRPPLLPLTEKLKSELTELLSISESQELINDNA